MITFDVAKFAPVSQLLIHQLSFDVLALDVLDKLSCVVDASIFGLLFVFAASCASTATLIVRRR